MGEKEEGGKKMVREALRRRVRTGGSLKFTKCLSDDGDTKVCPRRRAFLYLLDRVFVLVERDSVQEAAVFD